MAAVEIGQSATCEAPEEGDHERDGLHQKTKFMTDVVAPSSELSERSPRRASVFFIFVTLTIEAMGFGIIMPVLPDILRKFLGTEASVSQMYGYFIASFAFLQFVMSPILGRLSDRYGRRPVLLVSLLGTGIDYVFMALAPTLGLLFVGRLISGLTSSVFTVASAYIADISDDSNRSKNFGVMGAGFGLGFIMGPALGGLVAKHGLIYPFLAAAVLNLANFLFGLFVLPESLAPDLRRPFDAKALNPFKPLVAISKMGSIRALVIGNVFWQFAGQTHPSIWTLYTEHRYSWTAAQVGLSLTAVGALSAISQGVFTGPIVKYFGERKTVLIGALGSTVGFVLFGVATTGTAAYVILVTSSVFWASGPALQSLISREIPANFQGEIQGGMMSLISLTAIVNPLIMTSLFSLTSTPGSMWYMPGAPYYLAALVTFGAWLIMLFWHRRAT